MSGVRTRRPPRAEPSRRVIRRERRALLAEMGLIFAVDSRASMLSRGVKYGGSMLCASDELLLVGCRRVRRQSWRSVWSWCGALMLVGCAVQVVDSEPQLLE